MSNVIHHLNVVKKRINTWEESRRKSSTGAYPCGLGNWWGKIVFMIVFASSFIKLNKLCYPNICFGINSINVFFWFVFTFRVVFAACDWAIDWTFEHPFLVCLEKFNLKLRFFNHKKIIFSLNSVCGQKRRLTNLMSPNSPATCGEENFVWTNLLKLAPA